MSSQTGSSQDLHEDRFQVDEDSARLVPHLTEPRLKFVQTLLEPSPSEKFVQTMLDEQHGGAEPVRTMLEPADEELPPFPKLQLQEFLFGVVAPQLVKVVEGEKTISAAPNGTDGTLCGAAAAAVLVRLLSIYHDAVLPHPLQESGMKPSIHKNGMKFLSAMVRQIWEVRDELMGRGLRGQLLHQQNEEDWTGKTFCPRTGKTIEELPGGVLSSIMEDRGGAEERLWLARGGAVGGDDDMSVLDGPDGSVLMEEESEIMSDDEVLHLPRSSMIDEIFAMSSMIDDRGVFCAMSVVVGPRSCCNSSVQFWCGLDAGQH